MPSRLVNVRLDEDHVRKARRLRQSGVVLSEVVREAIDRRFEDLRKPRAPRDVRAILDGILERYPDPPRLPPRRYDVFDRRQARRAIQKRLRCGRR